jgi:hypothetical protein
VIFRRLLLVPVVLAVVALSGCGASDPAPERVSAQVPVEISTSTLRGLAREQVTLYEPFQKRRVTFQAVPLRAVLARVGVPAGAKTVHAVALNDYVVDIPLKIAQGKGVYLAVRNGDGSAIPVEDGGPNRIVFAAGAKGADVENYWIWSLSTVTFR